MSSRFEKTSRLPVEPETAYGWHARPGAFERLVPPWQSIRVVESSGHAQVDSHSCLPAVDGALEFGDHGGERGLRREPGPEAVLPRRERVVR